MNKIVTTNVNNIDASQSRQSFVIIIIYFSFYNSTKTQIPLLAAVSAFTSLPPRLCDCALEPRTDNLGRRLQGRDSRCSPARWLGVCEGTSRPLGPPTEETVGRWSRCGRASRRDSGHTACHPCGWCRACSEGQSLFSLTSSHVLQRPIPHFAATIQKLLS